MCTIPPLTGLRKKSLESFGKRKKFFSRPWSGCVTLWDCILFIRMTWFQVFVNPIENSIVQCTCRCSERQWRLSFDTIASCFQVQNNAGECHRKSTFFYDICTNTKTSIKCCRSVTRDYPSCTIMSALLPLQRIAWVSLEINFLAQ